MPGFYAPNEYDIAGFCCGIVKRNKIIDGKDIKGDMLIGLSSSGIHSNGYSLVRRLYGENYKHLTKYDDELEAVPIEVLLTPTKIYVKTILALIEKVKVNGIAHITGGGFIENIPRMLPKGLMAVIDTNSYEVPRIFKALQRKLITDTKAYNTFNMGVGMVIAVDEANADKVSNLKSLNEKAFIIGTVTKEKEKAV